MNEDTVTVDTDESTAAFDDVADPWSLHRDDLVEGILDVLGNAEITQPHEVVAEAVDIVLDEVARHLAMLDLDSAAEAVREVKE